MVDLKFDDDLDELLSDPGMINNPEKLMQMKVTEKDLEEASSTAWLEKADVLKEIILQDTSLNDMFRKLHDSEVSGDPGDPKRVVAALLANMQGYHGICLGIISEMKNKPFWNPATTKAIFSSQGEDTVQKWMKTLDTFGQTYTKANTLRLSRRSVLPNELNTSNEIITILSRLKEIKEEMGALVEVFDSVLETETPKHE